MSAIWIVHLISLIVGITGFRLILQDEDYYIGTMLMVIAFLIWQLPVANFCQ